MADKFDPYREALVIETKTIWPDDLQRPDASEALKIEKTLHADAAKCNNLQYIRVITGFCRQISVTAEDLQRLSS